jgi:hypothetical protein
MTDKEYTYFKNFIFYTYGQRGESLESKLLVLQTNVLEFLDLLLSERVDKDGKLIKSSDIIGQLYNVCLDKGNVNIESFIQTRRHNSSDEILGGLLATAMKNVVAALCDKAKFNETESTLTLQNSFYSIIQILCEINTRSIHELMCIKIEFYCHFHVIIDRFETILRDQHLEQIYRRSTMYPWKYTWRTDNMKLMTYMNKCYPHEIGRAMYLNDIVAQVQMRVWHDLYAHKHNEEEVAQVLAQVFNIDRKTINVRDIRTLFWPIVRNLKSPTFEEIWNEKYGLIYRNEQMSTKKRKRDSTPIRYSSPTVPNCPLFRKQIDL